MICAQIFEPDFILGISEQRFLQLLLLNDVSLINSLNAYLIRIVLLISY